MSNYPPGVTGNEPQITGEWPCGYCGGSGLIETPDSPCPLCKGSGIHPEESYEFKKFVRRVDKFVKEQGDMGTWEVEEQDGYIRIYTDMQVFGEWVKEEPND